MVTCQSSELGWEVTVELSTDFDEDQRSFIVVVGHLENIGSVFLFYTGDFVFWA